jgi:UDP-glucose 4-epimerase
VSRLHGAIPSLTAIPSLSTKRVIVTGASGFIGSNICTRLSSNGAEVHAVALGGKFPGLRSGRVWKVDMSDRAELRRIFKAAKPHIVFHLAGHVQGSRNLNQVWPTLSGNLVTTVNLLTMATEVGCERVVLTGTLDEPGPGESDASAFAPSSPYAASKFASSIYARMFRALYQSPVVIGRIFMTYGPGQRDLKKLIPYTILSICCGQRPKLSNATRPLDWTYIDDVVDGLLLISQRTNAEGHTFDLGTGVTHTARDAVERIIVMMHSTLTPVFGALQDRRMEMARLADISSTKARLEWRPRVSFEEGLQRTITWYRNQLSTGSVRLPLCFFDDEEACSRRIDACPCASYSRGTYRINQIRLHATDLWRRFLIKFSIC